MLHPTGDHPHPMDWDETAARELHQLLTAAGLPAQLWWERCPWGVRIPLTENLTDDRAPSLFVQIDTRHRQGAQHGPNRGPLMHEWFGTFRLTEHLDDEPLGWTTLAWTRPADDTATVATQILTLLRHFRLTATEIAAAARPTG